MKEDPKIIELKNKVNNEAFKRQEREIKEQKRQKKLAAPIKKKRKLNIINLIFTVFVFYFAFTAFGQYKKLNELNKEIDEKTLVKSKVEKEVRELQSDIAKMNDEEAKLELVEKIARNQYKMVKPNETIYIDKNRNENKLIQGIGFEGDLKN